MAPLVAPKYYIGLEARTYLIDPDELQLVDDQASSPLDIVLPMSEGVRETT